MNRPRGSSCSISMLCAPGWRQVRASSTLTLRAQSNPVTSGSGSGAVSWQRPPRPLRLASGRTCSELSARGLDHASLTSAIRAVVPAAGKPNGGLGFPMWLTLVDGSGVVCAVTTSLDGTDGNADATADIWLGSRVISAQKADRKSVV